MPRSTCYPPEVVALLARPDFAGRRFRILDFRRGRELRWDGGTKLVAVGRFAHQVEGELLYLVAP